MNSRRAGCVETRTPSSEGGPRKPTGGNANTAPRPDPYTKLRGPTKGVLYYLYTILDIFSRKVVGWTIALRESALIAEDVIRDAIVREGISRDQLTLHADRGGPMIAGGVTKSHSRPRVSNDKVWASYCAPLRRFGTFCWFGSLGELLAWLFGGGVVRVGALV